MAQLVEDYRGMQVSWFRLLENIGENLPYFLLFLACATYAFYEIPIWFFLLWIPTIKRGSPMQMQTMPIISIISTNVALDMKSNIRISLASTAFPEEFKLESELVMYGIIGK